jgi:hypothetical protein
MGRLGLLFFAPARGGMLRLLRGNGKVAVLFPTGDDFFQFVTEAIDDFSYQNTLSAEMMSL